MQKLLIVGFTALLLIAFTVPGIAKVKIGGIVFTDFYYIDRDEKNAAFLGVGNGNVDYTVATIQFPNISRFYARWTNEDNVGMYIGLGIGQASYGIEDKDSDGVILRHAYGWWNITPDFQIMAGKSTTPFSPLNPSQMIGTASGSLDIIGVGYGNFYSGRFVQVRGTFKFGKVGRIALALVDPNGTQRYHPYWNNFFPYDQFGIPYQNNTKIPRIDIAVPLYFGPVNIYPGFLYQHRTVDSVATSTYDNSISTYICSLGVKAGFGPFGISAEGQWGQNWANTRGLIGSSAPSFLASAQMNPDTGHINNAETYAYWIDASYKFGPATAHVMFGQENSKVDTYLGEPSTGFQARAEATSSFWGLSVPIDLAKGFRVRPEIMWYDDGEIQANGNDILDLGSYVLCGVQFQITF